MALKLLSKWLPVLVWAAFIFYLSNQPNLKISRDPFMDFILRKGAHIFVYFVLYGLLLRALAFQQKGLAFMLSILYAISDEYHQRFVVGRGSHPTDVLIDTIGISLAFILLWKLQPLLKNKRKI